MIIKALTSFACLEFGMVEGEVREVSDLTAKDLVKSGYAEEITAPKGKKKTPKGE